jgi:hypothetical protein
MAETVERLRPVSTSAEAEGPELGRRVAGVPGAVRVERWA